jgi:protein-S-isoprenylcysteine O-methyltransferase Ste14
MKTSHSWTFKRRGLLGGLVLLPFTFTAVLSRPRVPHGTPLDHAIDAIAWSFLLAFFVFRIWATLYIGDRKEEQLQTEGPYSMTRNPLYFGSFCFVLSVALFIKSATLLVAVALTTLIYARLVIRSEERVLEHKFGEAFRNYCAQTPRFFPDPRLYHAPEAVSTRLTGMRREIKRLIPHALLPFGALLVSHLRMQPWWPVIWHFP